MFNVIATQAAAVIARQLVVPRMIRVVWVVIVIHYIIKEGESAIISALMEFSLSVISDFLF